MILVGFLLICVDMESSVELHYFRFMDWKCRLWQRGCVLVQTKPLQHRPTRGRSRPRAAGEELFTLFCDIFLLFHSAQTEPSSCCIDRRGAAGSILVKWPAVLPPMTFLESETNPDLAQKSRQMCFNKVFSQSALLRQRTRVFGNLNPAWRHLFQFQIGIQPQDVCLWPDEGDVRPADGNPKKRWVAKSPRPRGYPTVQHESKSLSNSNFSGMP